MDAKQFIAEFGHIANAPGGGAKVTNSNYSIGRTREVG